MTTPAASSEFDTRAELFRVLGHETRLKLLTLLKDGERAVGEVEALTGIVQPGLSQQLAILRKASLVKTRREAKQVFYRLDEKGLADGLALLAKLAGKEVAGGSPGSQGSGRPRVGSVATFARMLEKKDG